jgi:hypothetical protein
MAGPLPQEMRDAAVAKIKSGQPDEFGATGVNAFLTDTEAWCLSKADSPDTIHKSHEAIGITLGAGDIKEVGSFIEV